MKAELHFTKKIIEALSVPKSGRVCYKDEKEKGLSLYVTSTGAVTFFVRKRINGRDERIILGSFPEMTLENARKEALKVKAEVAGGKNRNDEKQKLRQDITFGEMFTQFMERYSKPFKRSWQYDEREVNKFLYSWFKVKSSLISKHEVQHLHESVHNNNGLYQANRILERIRAIYNKAIEWGWDGINPALGIKKFKEKSRDRFLQGNELSCLFQALAEEGSTVVGDYILISLFTGARKSNVLSMRWSEVNFETKVWRIPETKNGDSLTIPLTEQALDILLSRKKFNKEYADNDCFVFPGSGAKGHLIDPKKTWKRLCQHATILQWQSDKALSGLVEKARFSLKKDNLTNGLYKAIVQFAKIEKKELPSGLMDVRIHDLRRTLGSWQAATGATTAIIGKSLGHKSQQATAVYERLNIDPVRASIERATEAMFNSSKKI